MAAACEESLAAGEVGFIVAGIKEIRGAPVGDTIAPARHAAVAQLPGFAEVKPQVYAGLCPVGSEQFEDFREALAKLSLNDGLLAHLDMRDRVPFEEGANLRALLKAHDFRGFAERLGTWLSGIPYQWHNQNDMARYEAWYASLLHMCFRAIGVDVRSEEATSRGRADMVVPLGDEVFILEFKMAESAKEAEAALEAAFAQMRDRGYADRYRGRAVHLVAVACGREVRNLLEVRAEQVVGEPP